MAKGSSEALGTLGELFAKGKNSDISSEALPDKLADLIKLFSGRERDSQGRVAFKLPLQILENRLNIEFKAQAKMGKNAGIEVIAYSTGFVYARLSTDWDKDSQIKPPAKYFTLKITPCYTELYRVSNNKPPRESTEFIDSEISKYENQIEKIAWETMCHNIECEFYKFSKISRPFSLKLPIVYSARFLEPELVDPGVLILEDFKRNALLPITTNLSLDALKSIVIALAEIHAACLDNPPDWMEWEFPSYGRLNATQFMPAVATIKNADPMLFGQLFDRIHDVISTCLKFHYADETKESLKMPPLVLTHGFLNPSNLRWKKNDEDEVTEELAFIINWQGVHPGSFCEDLAYLLSTCTSPEIRRNNTDALIELYVEQMDQKFPSAHFTVQQIKTTLIHQFRFEALRALLPIADFISDSSKNESPDNMNVLMRAKCLVEDLLLPEYDD